MNIIKEAYELMEDINIRPNKIDVDEVAYNNYIKRIKMKEYINFLIDNWLWAFNSIKFTGKKITINMPMQYTDYEMNNITHNLLSQLTEQNFDYTIEKDWIKIEYEKDFIIIEVVINKPKVDK